MYAETVIIYADILFLINFSLDYLGLFVTSRLLNRKTKTKRLIIAGIIGGLYSFVPYYITINNILEFILHILTATLMVIIAFEFKALKETILSVLTFIVSSALFGGLITSVYNLLGIYNNGEYREISLVSFCVICVVSVSITLFYGFISRRKINTRWAQIRISHKGAKFDLNLLSDSGNLITEPFSALPVIIAVSSALPYPFDNPESESFPFSARAIPFSTATGKGCFFGFRPDKIELIILGKKPKTIDAYIAVDKQNRAYSGYDGIIPASLI